MPKNTKVNINESYVYVSFDLNPSISNILGTIVILQYAEASIKYIIPLNLKKLNVTINSENKILIVKVYHYNDERSGEAYIKHAFNECKF